MVSTRRRATPEGLTPITIAYGGTTYRFQCRQNVQRIQVNDSPPYTPTSGQAQALTRSYHNVFSIKDIKNAFAHQVEMHFAEHAGIMDHAAGSNWDTRNGVMYAPPAENNPASATSSGFALTARPEAGSGVRPNSITTANMNPKMPKYFQGTTNTGVFVLRLDDQAGPLGEVEVQRWSGTAWVNEMSDLTIVDNLTKGAYDIELFGPNLCFLFLDNDVESVRYSSTGDTSTAFTNQPSVNAAQGSRLKTLGSLLWLFAYSSGSITVQEQTSNTGGAAWTTRGGASSLTGQLRDVEIFNDLSETPRIMVLTHGGLYWWDTTNYVFNKLPILLPNDGRALQLGTINEKPCLLIYMDAGRVYAYFADGATWDVSPGGIQGMPSGKDFGPSANGQVCVTASSRWAYGLWSGLDTGGSAIKPLILALDMQSVRLSADGKTVETAWHHIWQKADTSIASAASYIFIDPQSGDLLAGVQDATGESTTHVRLKDIEVSPELQATLDRSIAAVTLTTPRIDCGAPMVPGLLLDAFCHTSGLAAGKTLAVAFRVNGSTGAYTTVATLEADNTRVTFPANAATDVGTGFRDIQLQFTLDLNAVTDNVKVNSIDVGYTKVWPPRYLIVCDFPVEPHPSLGQPPAPTTWTNLVTIAGATTKVLLNYSKEVGQIPVLVLPEAKITEMLHSGYAPSAVRDGDWRAVFLYEPS